MRDDIAPHRTVADPSLIVPPPGEALPGEDQPLPIAEHGVSPISDDEVLGVWRRRVRSDLSEIYDHASAAELRAQGLPSDLEDQVPSALPSWTEKKSKTSLSLHPRNRISGDAYVEATGTNLSTLLDLLLYEELQRVPDAAAMAQRLGDYRQATRQRALYEEKARELGHRYGM